LITVRLIAGLTVFALTGCASASIVGGAAGGPSSTCPPARSIPIPSRQPPGTYPAATSPAPTSRSAISSISPPGFPPEGTHNLILVDACGLREGILVHVTITSTPTPLGADRHYDIAHVAIQNSGVPLPYGPGDFQFLASNGQRYDATSATLPESTNKTLGPGTLRNAEVQGDVIFDVPTGGGTVTYTSELGGNPMVWPTGS
jgi:hypothetical protein